MLEGYGLTETCAGVTLNLPGAAAHRHASADRCPGCAVRIADDGEVLIKGGDVFEGYWHNDEATREAFDADGWFHTGDIGELDDDGYLTITGRKKDLIVTAGGKNVAPAVLEDRLRAHWLVEPVHRRRRPPAVRRRAGHPRRGGAAAVAGGARPSRPGARSSDLREDPELVAALQSAVDDANAAVSHAEAIKRFVVLVGGLHRRVRTAHADAQGQAARWSSSGMPPRSTASTGPGRPDAVSAVSAVST